MSQTPAMSNNPGPERRFLDLDALVQYVQAMPTLVNDVKSFQQKVDDGMTAHVDRLNRVCHLANWLRTNYQHLATHVANLQAEVTLLQGICASSPLQKEDWQLGSQEESFSREVTDAQEERMLWDPSMAENDDGQWALQGEGSSGEVTGAQDREMTTNPAEAENEDHQLGLQGICFPHEVAHVQEEEMKADPVNAQGINAGDEVAENEGDREHARRQEQLARTNQARLLKNSKCKSALTKIEPLRNDDNLEPPSFPENLSALNKMFIGSELVKLMTFYDLDPDGISVLEMKKRLAEEIGISKKTRDKFLKH